MDLVIRGKNIDVPQNAKDYIAKKAKKFDRHLQSISKATVELSEEKTRSKDNRYIVEVTVDVQGTFLRGEVRGADIFSATDAVADVMDRQIKRYNDKVQGKKRKPGASKGKDAFKGELADDDDDETEGKIIRVKNFPMVPMSPDDAIEQMEFLGHDFFVFFNSENERFGVVYRRRAGDFGLIEPDFD